MAVLGFHYCVGFSLGAQASVVLALGHSRITRGLVAPWHVESSQIRDGTCVSFVSRQILYHGATREPLGFIFLWVISETYL